MKLQQVLTICKNKDISITRQREEIIKSVCKLYSEGKHPDVDEIYMDVKKTDPSLGIATIYRFLSILENAKIILKHHFGDGKARYEFDDESNHHDHLIDELSGDVIEFYDEELENLKNKIAQKLGYKLTSHRLELIGTKIAPSAKN